MPASSRFRQYPAPFELLFKHVRIAETNTARRTEFDEEAPPFFTGLVQHEQVLEYLRARLVDLAAAIIHEAKSVVGCVFSPELAQLAQSARDLQELAGPIVLRCHGLVRGRVATDIETHPPDRALGVSNQACLEARWREIMRWRAQ